MFVRSPPSCVALAEIGPPLWDPREQSEGRGTGRFALRVHQEPRAAGFSKACSSARRIWRPKISNVSPTAR